MNIIEEEKKNNMKREKKQSKLWWIHVTIIHKYVDIDLLMINECLKEVFYYAQRKGKRQRTKQHKGNLKICICVCLYGLFGMYCSIDLLVKSYSTPYTDYIVHTKLFWILFSKRPKIQYLYEIVYTYCICLVYFWKYTDTNTLWCGCFIFLFFFVIISRLFYTYKNYCRRFYPTFQVWR